MKDFRLDLAKSGASKYFLKCGACKEKIKRGKVQNPFSYSSKQDSTPKPLVPSQTQNGDGHAMQ